MGNCLKAVNMITSGRNLLLCLTIASSLGISLADEDGCKSNLLKLYFRIACFDHRQLDDIFSFFSDRWRSCSCNCNRISLLNISRFSGHTPGQFQSHYRSFQEDPSSTLRKFSEMDGLVGLVAKAFSIYSKLNEDDEE